MTSSRLPLVLAACAVLLASSCNDNNASGYPEHLSDWGFFTGDPRLQQPAPGVVPYAVISTLFADFAVKHRFIRLPAGQTIHYDPLAKWTLPVGTVIVKTFAYPIDARHPEMGEHIVETRLLVHETDAWHPVTYRWDDAQTDGVYEDSGPAIPITWIDDTGATRSQTYKMPNINQCRTCHGEADFEPIGPRTRQLDRDGQLEHFASLGMFDVAPEPAASRVHFSDPYGTDSLDLRARSYLDANCAHCHNMHGHAGPSGLWLDWDERDPMRNGVCKLPQSAGPGAGGFTYDIVPGDAPNSIMHYRITSTDPDAKMPELGSLLNDPDGVTLLTQWIDAMPPTPCVPTP